MFAPETRSKDLLHFSAQQEYKSAEHLAQLLSVIFKQTCCAALSDMLHMPRPCDDLWRRAAKGQSRQGRVFLQKSPAVFQFSPVRRQKTTRLLCQGAVHLLQACLPFCKRQRSQMDRWRTRKRQSAPQPVGFPGGTF